MNDVYDIDNMEPEAIKLMIPEIQDFGIMLENEVIEDMPNRSKTRELPDRLMERGDNKRVR